MAEALASAALGYAVNTILDKVLDNFKLLNSRSANVLKLKDLLERSQPALEQLRCFDQLENYPGDKWLLEFRGQLEKCCDLVKASSTGNWNPIKALRTSKESVMLYGSIYALLQESSFQQWASGLSIQSISIQNDAKILTELKATQERDEQLVRRIADLHSKLDILGAVSKLEQLQPSPEILDGSSSSAIPTEILWKDCACDPEPKVTFGGEAIANELINHLLSNDCKKWIALYGMGGIGKTFTARKVHLDSRIQRHFSGGIIWLTVSKDQRGPHYLLKQLLCKIEGRESVSQLPKNLRAARCYLKSKLDTERVLLILDDVWQDDVLEYLDVISESKEGVILVTTRDQGILRMVIDSVKIFEIPRLSEEDSWQFFSYHAFRARGRVVSLEVGAVAKEVAQECGGLPLALEVMGSMMADKVLVPAERALGQSTSRIWEIALERLRNANHGNNEYEALYSKLQLSVDSLSEQDSRLRDCFLYFAAFPEDEHVLVEELVRMWIAEGLVQDDVDSSFSAEEEGKVLLGFLVAKSMIEMTDPSWGRSCKIHDVLRNVALRNLSRDFSRGSARKCLYAAGLHKSELPKRWTISATSTSVERLSLRENNLRRFPEPEQFDAPNLQVLILSRNWSLRSVSPRFFQNLSKLSVLDLSKTGIEKIPGVLLRKLESLVLLDLTHCRQLQEVSDEINSLLNLKFLLLGTCDKLQKLPQVNRLTNLEVYCTTVPRAEAETEARIPWWKHHIRSNRDIPYMLPANLKKLNLYFLTASNYLFDVSTLGCLEELRLEGSIKSYPSGIMDLHHLRILKIEGDCPGAPVPALGRLPRLEDLTMEVHNGTESFGCAGAFPSLKKFHIMCVPQMEKMFVFHPGTMPRIESLVIEMDRKAHFPTSIAELRSLKRLEVTSLEIIRDEDLELVFKQVDCFPQLEFLRITESGLSPNLEFLRITGRGRILRPKLMSNRLPKHFLERLEQGKLTIEHGN